MARRANGTYEQGSNNVTEGHPPYSVTPKAPRSLFRHIMEEDQTRENMVKNIRKLSRKPREALLLLEKLADYLEGSPKKTVEHSVRQQPRFLIQPEPPALTPPPDEPVA